MSFDNDEPPPAISSSSTGRKPSHAGVRMVAYSNKTAPLEQNTQQVLLEIIDTSSIVHRSGLDLVAVLDVSQSMEGMKLDKTKTAMKFVIGKLGPTDRLSIVTFSDEAELVSPLVCMTTEDDAKKNKLKDVVDGLKTIYRTNMERGLETGRKVLADRRHRVGRVGSIILMSDGYQSEGDATRVSIGDVAVYTFGFGANNDAKVLETIASKSRGGTFNYVRDEESLSEHFSQILAGLLSVVVQDLELTVWQPRRHSEIRKVDAGGYLDDPRTPVDENGSITVSFGDLYAGEVRKVIVELELPFSHTEYTAIILFAQCQYSVKGNVFYSPGPREHLGCSLRRTGTARPEEAVKPDRVNAEVVRRGYVIKLLEASQLKNLDLAKSKLEEAKKDLDDAENKSASSTSSSTRVIISILRIELELFLGAETWNDLLACLLASWTSHSRQRGRIFETQLMRKYLAQATEFDKNPNVPVRSVDEEVKREEEKIRGQFVDDDHHHEPQQQRIILERKSSDRWAWRALIPLCTVLAIALIVAGVAVFVVYLLYKPKTPYLAVSDDARLVQLQYDQDGTIQYLQASITILAENNNSKADAYFSRVELALGFNGADVALLRAEPFVVARRSALPLRYNVVSAGKALDPAGVRAMDEALKAGVVPLDLLGKAHTRWRVGVFLHVKFWTRVSCRLRFFFPGNGTVMTTDGKRCRSRSP